MKRLLEQLRGDIKELELQIFQMRKELLERDKKQQLLSPELSSLLESYLAIKTIREIQPQ